MAEKDDILAELGEMPETVLRDALDFARFLRTRQPKPQVRVMLLSQASLERDWLRPEEDETWADL